jgi:ABC-type dipeptide/oligopeptide/nickel transport system permease component
LRYLIEMFKASTLTAMLVRRLLAAVAVIYCVVTVTFIVAHAIPSDPARAAAGLTAGPAQVQATEKALGLDRPFLSQYFSYIGGLLHGSFGISYATRQPIGPQLMAALPATLELVFWSFVIYVITGVASGMLWAAQRGRPIAGLLRGITSLFSAAPVFWLAIVAQIWIASKLGWLPIDGRFDMNQIPPRHITGFYTIDALLTGNLSAFVDAVQHLVLPVATLVIWMYGLAARLTQKSAGAELDSIYVRTALAKGASTRRIMMRHVFRNAMNPVLTVLGLQFGWLLGGTVLVEVIFSWPGIGNYMYTALQTFDFPVITAVAIVITCGFVLVNLVVDLLYPVLDPRLR